MNDDYPWHSPPLVSALSGLGKGFCEGEQPTQLPRQVLEASHHVWLMYGVDLLVTL